MKYSFPDEEIMAKYLAMLRDVIVMSRFRAYEYDEQTAELLDAVENVPDLLCRWPDMNESIVVDSWNHTSKDIVMALIDSQEF